MIEESAAVIDRVLPAPAHWQGPIRRELLGHCQAGEAHRYRDAFDWVADNRPRVDEDLLVEVHRRAVEYAPYRKVHLWVDNGYRHPEPEEIHRLVRLAFDRFQQQTSPAPARSAGLHLDILTAHPFRDGNGRTARITAAAALIAHGYRSTLLTAVEQYFAAFPSQYLGILDDYRFARACRWNTVARLLTGAASASAAAAWARTLPADPSPSTQEPGSDTLRHHPTVIQQVRRLEDEERRASRTG